MKIPNNDGQEFGEKKAIDGDSGEKKATAEDVEKLSWNCWLRTLFAASGAMLAFVFNGITEAQSAILVSELKKEGSRIHVTPNEESWIASLGLLLSPVSCFIIGPAIDVFGRKKGVMFFYFCMGLGFGIIASAQNVYHIYTGRCFCAFGNGMIVVSVVYLAEVSTKRQRTIIFAVIATIYCAGVMLTYAVSILPWYTASAIFSFACLVIFIIQCFMPESPSWLYKTGQLNASTESLQRLGRSPSSIFKDLQHFQNETTATFQLSAFLLPTVWKPFVIMAIFFLLQSGSGVYDILFYTVDFVETLGTAYDPLNISRLISVVRFLTSITIGIYLRTFLSRKFATALSALGMTAAFAGMGVYEYIYQDTPLKPFQLVPIVLLFVSVVSCTIGLLNLPQLMSGEVFPFQVRGVMTGTCFLIGCMFRFLTVKTYHWCLDALQLWGLLLVFALISFLGIFFGIFILPETQNKTLYEVEQGFLPKPKPSRFKVETPKIQIETIS